jgi:hypothetical protein
MSDLFEALQKRYHTLLDRKVAGGDGELAEDVSAFIADVRHAGASVADVGERSQLRAWMRFLADVVYEAEGVYPDTSLQPLAHGQLIDPRREPREPALPLPTVAWALIGGTAFVAAVALILALIGGWDSWSSSMAVPTSAVTPGPNVSATERAEALQSLRLTATAQSEEIDALSQAVSRTDATAVSYATQAAEAEAKMAATRAFQATQTAQLDEVTPVFSNLSLALSVEPDGTPILPLSGNRFDWNTKTICAVFDYAGMRDGMRWSVVWLRGEQEVARQGGRWDADVFGTEGTHWVTYHNERGQTIRGGTYSVTLSIEDVRQEAVGFNVLYYTPSE